eukprot:PhF_6_TR30196/c0_g1_i5/m.44378
MQPNQQLPPVQFPPGKENDRAYWSERLMNFYKVKQPEKATQQDVDKTLTTFESKGGYVKMWEMLQQKYGPEGAPPPPGGANPPPPGGANPPPQATPAGAPGAAPTQPLPPVQFPPGKENDRAYWSERLMNFYKVKQPEKATQQDVDKTLTTFESKG